LKLSYKAEYDDGMAIWKTKHNEYVLQMCIYALHHVPLHFEENWVPKFKMLLCITQKIHPRLYNNTFKWQALAEPWWRCSYVTLQKCFSHPSFGY
jgi:hypothetical protein